MIVTIDDYRGAANSRAGDTNTEPPNDADVPFTVATAGHLKLKLQALNNTLTRTPQNQHCQIQFDDILKSASPRTYVDGSEEVYFLLKSLPWPTKIPEVFIGAYSEVLQLRPFTNTYVPRISTPKDEYLTPHFLAARFAPTFSRIRSVLSQLDAVCNTKLDTFFQSADEKVQPFPFMQLPTELRLQVYDFLVPSQPFVRLYLNEFPRPDAGHRLPEGLEIMRVSKRLHQETSKHIFGNPTLLIEARRSSLANAKGFFTEGTSPKYAERVESMHIDTRRKFTHLEIKILPCTGSLSIPQSLSGLTSSPMRRIFTALPNLTAVIISYTAMHGDMLAIHRAKDGPQRPFYVFRRHALDWIRSQLPEDARVRVLWDLTYFRYFVKDTEYFRKSVMHEQMMRELIERDGGLELATSATATSKDLERWSEIKDMVTKAVKQR